MIHPIRCISLWQPWAYLITTHRKKIETRGWKTKHRGPLAIHASKRPVCKIGRALLVKTFPELAEKRAMTAFLESLPRGAVVATCNLMDCIEVGEEARLFDGLIIPPPEPELSFGDYSPRRFAWILKDVVALAEPCPRVGRQQLFWWTPFKDTAA